jgi:cephalosporin-C deacetylase-like acetyl esterase
MLGRTPEPVPLDVRVEWTATGDGYHETRFRFMAEAGQEVPAHLLVPAGAREPVPVLVCLQGHNSGMHISLGQSRSEVDREDIASGRDYAVQVVRKGWAALAIEQRGFGERVDARPEAFRHGVDRPCHHLTATALLRGRTLLGERVWDVARAIDALASFPGLDLARIGCVGDSTGGTITFFAACMDPRIAVAMPVAYVSSFRRSLLEHDHCEDHYLPGFLRYFELGDLAALIAPRPLLVVAGQEDIAFPIEGAHEAYDRISEIYAWLGAGDRCRLIVGPEGHRFYPDLAWPAFEELSGWRVEP